ncbi:MAG: zinc ribbon domain-containing protein [Pseudomonadota bacterium]
MPSYDYRCPANDRVVEVRHGMNDTVNTWGELCQLAGIEPGDTPAQSSVEKVFLTAGGIVGSAALKNPAAPPCMSGGGCAGGMCGLG